jgi:hypothetical protein
MEDFIFSLEDLLAKLQLDQTKLCLNKEKQDLYNNDLSQLETFYGRLISLIAENNGSKKQPIFGGPDSDLLLHQQLLLVLR